jgi:signal transduction histidine kinase
LWPLWLLGAALGIAAESSLYGWSRPGDWLPDLVTGWCLLGCGLVGWSRRPGSWSGALLTTTGFAWFAPNFATTGAGGLDWLSVHALYLHRAPLVALVLTYPRGRPAGRFEAAVITGFCVVAVITPVWRNEVAAIALSGGIIGVAALEYIGTVGRERRMRLRALQATALVGATIAATAAVRLAVPGNGAATATLRAYEAMLCALSVWLLIGLLRAPWERSAVTDLVVELGEERSGTLRNALARALGDPSLELGFWLQSDGVYVDPDGHPLRLPPSGSPQRSTTRIDRDGQPLAVLVHDSAVLSDQGLVDAVASATKLAAANMRLRANVRARVSELADSRRRLIAAGDEERARIERRLSDSAQRRLAQLAGTLNEARLAAVKGETIERISHANAQLVRTQQELRSLARGIHSRELSERGLQAALAEIAADYPIPVTVSVSTGRLPASAESCAYFVCTEALANVTKYASASRVRISISDEPTGVTVRVEDDGVGGADPLGGTGLRGLADRIDALGGTFTVVSPADGGTQLVATVPSGERSDA